MGENLKYKAVLPSGWALIDFEQSCEKISLNGIKIKQKQYLQKGKYPVIDQGQELIGGYFDDENLIVPSEPPYVIFGDHTKVKKYINFRFIAGADGVKVFKTFKILNEKLFFYFLYCIKLPDKGYARHSQFLEKAEFPLPPLPEQHRIVAKIEELFSSLNKGIENLKTARQQIKVYRQAVLKWAFEGKLTNNNVADGQLPDGWKLVRIEEVAELNPKLPNKEKMKDDFEVQFLPMKLVEEINGQIHLTELRNYGDVKKSYTSFINGDVIFAKVTPCMENGKIAKVDNLHNGIGFGSTEFHVIRCNKSVVALFVFHFLVQEGFRKKAERVMTGAVGLRRVPKQFIEKYIIPLPPIDVQHLIISQIESRLSVCDKIEETIEQSLKQSEALRQSILKKAFEGKLVPQDPNDEPASVLLDRIRNERSERPAPQIKTRSRK